MYSLGSGLFCGDEGSNTSGKRSFLFVEVIGTHDMELRLIDLGRFGNIRIFDKVFNFGGYMFLT